MTRSRTNARPRPEQYAGHHEISSGTAEVVADNSSPGGWSILINGVPSSYVHVDDPTRLDFEYMQWTGHVLDAMRAEAAPVRAVHIGGAGCTLARYVAATRPGSRQAVLEVDPDLVTLMRNAFGLRAVPGLRLRGEDGLEAVRRMPSGHTDVVVRDAFDGATVPHHLTTVEFYSEMARVLGERGVYVGNVADTAGVRESRIEAAAAREAFANVAFIAEPAQLRGRRFGNVIVVASQASLPDDALVRRLAGGAVRARYVGPERVAELSAGIHPR